jgi:hypothetical protein
LEGRWAALAIKAQRDGVLDYRNYTPLDASWLMKECILLDSIEDNIMSEHCKILLPNVTHEAKSELFDNILRHDTPWIAKELTAEANARRLMQMYKDAKAAQAAQEQNGTS